MKSKRKNRWKEKKEFNIKSRMKNKWKRNLRTNNDV